jgi:hypothetical protein
VGTVLLPSYLMLLTAPLLEQLTKAAMAEPV